MSQIGLRSGSCLMKHGFTGYGLSLRFAAVPHIAHAVNHAITIICEQQGSVLRDCVADWPSIISP